MVSECVEVESGKANRRPVLIEAVTQCRRDKCTLVVAKLDRLSRSVSFISTLMEGGVEFLALDAPYANKLMLHILAAFAEFEREQISNRTRAALAAAKARGVRLGVHGRTLADRNVADATRFASTMRPKLAELRSDGPKTLQELANRLNEANILSRQGSRWHAASVARVLRRVDAISVLDPTPAT